MRFAVPLLLLLPPAQDSSATLIDSHIQARWKDEGVKAAKTSSDAEFLRRVTLDVVGRIPPADRAIQFLRSRASDKRRTLVEELLSSREYAEYWADVWDQILLGGQDAAQPEREMFRAWLLDDVFAKNLPYDEFVRRVIATDGIQTELPAVIFMLSQADSGGRAPAIASKVSKVFAGTQIQCAQCHDHPFDRWTQEHFWAMAAFFGRLRRAPVDPKNREDRRQRVFDDRRGEVMLPGEARKVAKPAYLDGAEPEPGETRRAAFARLLTRKDNLQFSKAIVNRMWGQLFGRGLVHPIAEFNEKNRPSHAEVLDALARAFLENRCDLKWLIRTIVMSETYQLSSSAPDPKKPPGPRLYARSALRALSPDQLFNAMAEATGAADLWRLQGEERIRDQKRNMLRQFRFTFGDDEADELVEFDGTILQALMMLNSDLMNNTLAAKNSRLDLILQTRDNWELRLELIFLSILSRPPTALEKAVHGLHLKQEKQRPEAFQDIFWALLNSSEFFFNH